MEPLSCHLLNVTTDIVLFVPTLGEQAQVRGHKAAEGQTAVHVTLDVEFPARRHEESSRQKIGYPNPKSWGHTSL